MGNKSLNVKSFSSKSSSIPQMFFTFAIKHLISEFLKIIWEGVKKKKNLDTLVESLPSVKHVSETSQYHPASSQSGIWAKIHEETQQWPTKLTQTS